MKFDEYAELDATALAALVRDGEGRPVTRAAQVDPGARLQIEFADGVIEAADTRGAPPKRPRTPKAKEQGSLL